MNTQNNYEMFTLFEINQPLTLWQKTTVLLKELKQKFCTAATTDIRIYLMTEDGNHIRIYDDPERLFDKNKLDLTQFVFKIIFDQWFCLGISREEVQQVIDNSSLCQQLSISNPSY